MSEPGRSVTVRLPSGRGLGPLMGLLAAALLIAGSVVAGVRTHRVESRNDQLTHGLSSYALSALSAARGYAIEFATYKYDNLTAAFAATEAHSVDPFLSQYRSETAELKVKLVQAKSSSSATVVSAGLASISSTGAVVDLFLNQKVTNIKSSQVDAQRVEMTMVRLHDRWLISKVVLP